MKNFLLVTSLLLMTSYVHAQYLVSATVIATRSASSVQAILSNNGWQTSQMELNGVTSYKITYNTNDVFGEPTVASGALYVPQIESDSMPLVSYHHGTEFLKIWVPSNNKYFTTALLYSGNGYITTLPDYLGLGDNPGLHPYVHWESEATASIDLIRAAREFLNDSLQIWDNDQLFLTGASQGGHSTMAVHKYITENNLQSEFNVIGSAPLSGVLPLYDVQWPEMFDEDSSFYRSEFLPYAMASFQLVYGNLYNNYNEYYDPPYDSIIADWLASGIHDGSEWSALIPDNFYDFMQDSVLENIKNDPGHPFNIALRQNDLHNWIPQEPVRMLYCGMDSMAFPQNSIMAEDTMNALGAVDVQAIEVDQDCIHETSGVPTTTWALEWFDYLRIITSIPSMNKQVELTLYPNPVIDIATFSSGEIASFELYDITGKIIARRNGNTIDMTNMTPGIYFVNGYDTHHTVLYTGKIIKK